MVKYFLKSLIGGNNVVINVKKIFKVLLAVSVITIVLGIGLASFVGNSPIGDYNSIGLININNVIGEESSSSFLEPIQPSFLSQLRSAEKDHQIQALVLRINSPGGSAATSQELYQTVLRIRNKGIPVVVSMGDVAASGGYYIAAAADHIFANGATITGSIGVIMQFSNYQELLDKVGIKFETVKSGQFKDAGSGWRSLTPTERDLFNELILDTWDQFVTDIVTARGLDRGVVEAVADGRILTGRQALEVGLVDEIGGMEEAIQKAKELANIEGTVNIKEYVTKPRLIDRLLAVFQVIPQFINEIKQPAVRLKYQQP